MLLTHIISLMVSRNLHAAANTYKFSVASVQRSDSGSDIFIMVNQPIIPLCSILWYIVVSPLCFFLKQ